MLIILSLPQLKWSAKHRMSLLYRTGFNMIATHLFWHSAWFSPTTENWGFQAPGGEGDSSIFLQHSILDQASLSVATFCKPPQHLTLLPQEGKQCRGLDAYFVFLDIPLKLIHWKQKRLISVFETPHEMLDEYFYKMTHCKRLVYQWRILSDLISLKKAVGIFRAKNEPRQVFIPYTLMTPIDSIIESAFHQL